MRLFVFTLLVTACLSISQPASAAQFQIGQMNITTGSLMEPLQGLYPTLIHIGPDTNVVGGYIGSGGTTVAGYSDYAADNLMVFELNGATASVYTAASNLGDIYSPAGSIPGGTVPVGTLDTEAGTIALDVTSFFVNSNDTDSSAAPLLGSPAATGSWDPQTGMYSLNWSFYLHGGGFGQTWYINLAGTALPVPEASTSALLLAGLGFLLPWARKRRIHASSPCASL